MNWNIFAQFSEANHFVIDRRPRNDSQLSFQDAAICSSSKTRKNIKSIKDKLSTRVHLGTSVTQLHCEWEHYCSAVESFCVDFFLSLFTWQILADFT